MNRRAPLRVSTVLSRGVVAAAASTIMADDASVQVVVRMRPLNERELKGNTLPVVTASTEKKEIVVIKGSGNRQQRTTYNFDNVLGTQSSQEDVFEQTIQPVIADVLGGFECTMFAYGQTGTGKTHTMEGDLANPENQGVIPRAAQAIFDLLSDPKFRDSDVTASYLEIYNEELSDLLIDDSKEVKLQICEDNKPRGKGLFVQNLSEVSLASRLTVSLLLPFPPAEMLMPAIVLCARVLV